jgi:uncharacterized protein (DUF1778 family)
MAVRKISISIDEDVLDDAKACADAEGVSLSAWLVEAARDRAKVLGWERLFREYEEEFGAFTEEELAEADAWIDEGERRLEDMRRTRGR